MSAAYGYDGDADYSMTTGYIGPHCDNGIIGIGLFSDEYCTNYVGNKFDIFNVTEYEVEAATIDNIYVPDGCHTCAGENVSPNITLSLQTSSILFIHPNQ